MSYRRTLAVCIITVFAAALMLAPVSAQAVNPVWWGDYFNNATLSGEPVVSHSDANIGFDWGTGSPAEGVPADNFSVRWGTDVALTPGTYRVTASADDNIRVIFDYQETPLIDTFGQALSGQQVTADFTVAANGTYHIQVDYQEISDNAFANVAIVNLSGTFVPQEAQLPTSDVTATVIAGRLNVRDEPSTRTGDILTVVTLNQTFPVIASNEDASWYLINVDGTQGWVAANWVTLDPVDADVPVAGAEDTATEATPEATAAAPTGDFVVTASPFAVNIRSGPGVQNSRIGRLPAGQSAQAIGRNADNTWWNITYNDITGWVSAEFALMPEGTDVTGLPITDTGTSTDTGTGTSTSTAETGTQPESTETP